MDTTFGVPPDTADWYYCAVIERPDGETDYIDGYATGAEPTRSGLREHAACQHSWVGGMMHVHEEDLKKSAATRKVECEKCNLIYGQKEQPAFRILEWTTQKTPHSKVT
jgi:hypothetical protein